MADEIKVCQCVDAIVPGEKRHCGLMALPFSNPVKLVSPFCTECGRDVDHHAGAVEFSHPLVGARITQRLCGDCLETIEKAVAQNGPGHIRTITRFTVDEAPTHG